MSIHVINNEYVELINGDNVLRVSLAYGPRIIWFGKVGRDNLLYFDASAYERSGWKLYGGHRVWLTRPLADESEDTYQADNNPCHYDMDDKELIIWSDKNRNGIILGMRIKLLEKGRFSVTNFIRNAGELIYSAGVWSPTCILPRPDMRFAVSIGSDDTWDLIHMTIPRRFAGNTVLINDPQISFNEHFMLVEPKGIVAKRCLYSAKGKLVMTWPSEKLTFIKSVKSVRNGNYQSSGCNTAIFVGQDNFMVELESYGEEKAIYPSEVIEHEEIWSLYNESISLEEYSEIEMLERS